MRGNHLGRVTTTLFTDLNRVSSSIRLSEERYHLLNEWASDAAPSVHRPGGGALPGPIVSLRALRESSDPEFGISMKPIKVEAWLNRTVSGEVAVRGGPDDSDVVVLTATSLLISPPAPTCLRRLHSRYLTRALGSAPPWPRLLRL